MHAAVTVALGEVGYLEKETPVSLDNPLQNAGDENYTKYARDLDEHFWFYFGNKQGLPWCDVFVDWCFIKAYGARKARILLCQPILSRGAGCRFSYGYYQSAGRIVSEPREGDQIFFAQNGTVCHTGLVESADAEFVYTIEGNTSDTEGIIPNGGCVARKRYPLKHPGIAGYGRPRYAKVGEPE